MICNNLSKWLGEKRIKISDISRETGISRMTLTSIYNERNKAISFDVLEKLCKFFKCSIGDLLYISNENEEITKDAFMYICVTGGYAHREIVDEYIQRTGKDSFTHEDLENVYRIDSKFWNPFDAGKFGRYEQSRSTKKFDKEEV